MRMPTKILNFFYLDCRDISTSSNQNVVSIIVNLSKTLVYDDLSINKVKTLQTVEAIQPELMVMLDLHCAEVGFTSDKEIFETLKDPHQSLLCIEDQPNTQILLPPLELHDLIAHALEESYTASTHAQRKWSTFLMFSCMS